MSIHPHGYWLDKNHQGHHFDPILAEKLNNLFTGQSVLDIGCGSGDYVEYLSSRGIDIVGVDGNPNTPSFKTGLQVIDASQPFCMDKRDWVLSIEVGEHIPKQYEKNFLDNITRHSRVGIVLSWALPGQGGRGHYNERTNKYIIQQLGEYRYDQKLSMTFRENLTLSWLRNTLMIFYKR